MIVMSEVLLLNSKDIEMGLEEGGRGGGGSSFPHRATACYFLP